MSLSIALLVQACNGGDSSPESATSDLTNNGTTPVACTSSASSRFVRVDDGPAQQGSATPSAGGKFRKLKGHVLHAIQDSKDEGKVDDAKSMPITVSLSLNNVAQLEREIAEMYRPGSASFHRFMKPEEFRQRFAPTSEQIAKVTQYLKDQGMDSVQADSSGLLVHAQAKASSLSSAFQTEVHQYAHKNGRSYFANSYEPQIPEGLPIQGVHGLQSYSQAHNHLRKADAASPNSGSGPGGGFSPADIRAAYNIPDSLKGDGQTLAVFELDGYSASNITSYESQFGLPATPLKNVLVDNDSGSAGGGQAEVELDIELMIAVAPNAKQILVYEGPNSDQGILDTYAKIASDNLAQSVSTSWGSSEEDVTSSFIQSENTIFMQMAAQGQTIYSAAGDNGANNNGSSLSVDDPSSQPYMVAVGGTSLNTSSSGSYTSESTWNNSSGGGGGGISTVWSIPSYQQGLDVSQSKGSTSMRMIPDVSINADIQTGYAIYTGGSWGTWGGTSASAPIWAAFNALVNQQRATNGLGPIGHIAPLLYAIGGSSSYANDFNDVADKSTNGYFPAVTGFDLATGWGSFKAGSLIEDLAANPSAAPTGSDPTTGTGSSGASPCSVTSQ